VHRYARQPHEPRDRLQVEAENRNHTLNGPFRGFQVDLAQIIWVNDLVKFLFFGFLCALGGTTQL